MIDEHPDLQKCIGILSEQWDTVQIFVSRYDSETGLTTSTTRGTGNWFARQAQVRYFLVETNEQTRHDIRKLNEESE